MNPQKKAEKVAQLDEAFEAFLQVKGEDSIQAWKDQFSTEGIVNIHGILTDELWDLLVQESREMVSEFGVERDIQVSQTDNSPRKMTTVANSHLRNGNGIIPAIYDSKVLQRLLGEIAGEPVLECPAVEEQLAISLLTEPGHTHGWHWDDYSFGMVWLIESPRPEDGGFTQCIPNTKWNKDEPRVHQTMIDNPIKSYAFEAGGFYFFRSGTTMHRVYPLQRKTRRLIVNMDWASEADLSRDISLETTDSIYVEKAAV